MQADEMLSSPKLLKKGEPEIQSSVKQIRELLANLTPILDSIQACTVEHGVSV